MAPAAPADTPEVPTAFPGDASGQRRDARKPPRAYATMLLAP